MPPMKIVLILIESLSAILFTAGVLLHSAKGEGLGGIGGQARLFSSPKGLEAGLDRFTGIAAIVFMGSAVLLWLFT